MALPCLKPGSHAGILQAAYGFVPHAGRVPDASPRPSHHRDDLSNGSVSGAARLSVRRILHVDPCAGVRESFRATIESGFADCRVTGISDIREALVRLGAASWDLVALEIRLDHGDGWQLLDHLRVTRPSLPVLILSDAAALHAGLRAFRAGAAGWIDKGRTPDDIITAVLTVGRGGRVVPSEIAPDLACWVLRFARRSPAAQRRELPPEVARGFVRWAAEMNLTSPEARLTPGERRVMDAWALGWSLHETALRLGISTRTVSICRGRILAEMGFPACDPTPRASQTDARRPWPRDSKVAA